jgi:endonuclease/exonuclease/phosphatase (EEP) superfamily protein YafD
MFNETRLTSPLYLEGYVSHQTFLKRSGGCITFSNLTGHKKVKALGTYLTWSKVLLGEEEVHILNVYLEPGQERTVIKRAETVINLAKDIVKQDAGAKIIIGGDLNGQLSKMHTFLTIAGFIPALRVNTSMHRDGNQLDQMWVRNLTITNAIVADPIDQVSDHNLIQVKMEATCIERVERV